VEEVELDRSESVLLSVFGAMSWESIAVLSAGGLPRTWKKEGM
jgi:hypothetical protein